MKYPREFSAQARARVEAERLRANRAFEEAQDGSPPAEWTLGIRVWDEALFYNYVLRVFMAFVREACSLGEREEWTVDRIRSEAEEFLRRFTIEAYYERGRDRSGRHFPSVTGDSDGSLTDRVRSSFRNSEDWRQYEDALLAVAEVQSADASEPEDAPKGVGNHDDCARGRRARVDAYIAEVLSVKKKRITRTDIWKAAGYKTRTEFERWERCDQKATQAADDNIRRILAQKPHLN